MKKSVLCPLLMVSALMAGCSFSDTPVSSSSPAPVVQPTAPAISDVSVKWADKASEAYRNGNNVKAIELSDKALKADKNNYIAMALKGVATAMHGHPKSGEQMIRKSLTMNPQYIPAYYNLAIALKLQKKYTESTQAFQKVLSADARNTWSYYGIATNYSELRNKDEALNYLKKAVSLGGQEVKQTAATQDHFFWLHGDPDFEAVIR